ncbi:two-component regulator propeller domain-containing protein [Fulvivirga kasyanovii]|uniref:GAF domain-containing protein n=1 Tax=Fulvivirga kasyanovii TaxID=396812 RepID=A0ABW9RQ54_9BACT|nr:two-component regulator propeller domain-containing protein [Fulvivirga kasyanovii]MTI25220.1 GAF domain-containing protein [Fulvivirga kasyanovii]
MRKLYKRLVVILLFTMLGNGLCQAQELHFKRLSLKEGLSQSSVRQIIQDRQGFIWVTTEEGLNRYDGYQFLNFNHDKNDPNSLGDQFTSSIWEAPDGNLWVGTNSAGVNKMDIEHETFTRYIHIPGDKGTLPDNNVYVFIGDSLGYLWVGTVKGLVQLEIKSGKVLDKYIHIPDNSTSLSHDIIYGLLKDSQGNLWVGTHNGLNKKAPNSRSFKRYMYNSNPQDLTSHRVSKIYEDRSGRIWIGTHRGLYLYDKSTEGFTRIRHTTRENNSFNANIVLTMLEDHEGTFWVGTRDGLFRSSSLDFENGVFNFDCYRYNPQNESSISDNVIYSLFEDNSNILWVGTSIGGLCKVDLDGQQFKHYKRAPDNMPGLNESSAWSFYQFDSGEIWVGTSGGGINRFDAHMNLLSYMLPSRQEENSLSGNRIWDIEQDRDGNVWIGVFGEGLNKYVPKDGSFVHYLHNAGDSASIGSNSVIDILVDDSGIILIGTWGEGLDVLDPQTGIFTHVKEVPGFVTTIAKTSEHLYWIGTMNQGLFHYNHSTGEVTAFNTDEDVNSLASNTIWGLYSRHPDTLYAATDWGFDQIILNNGQPVFKNYNESHGLSKNTVYSIVGDDLGFLWMITTHGLSRFNPSDNSFFNFYEEDGIQSNEFNHGAVYKGKDGKLFLGGINGFNIIDPTQIKVNTKVPPVYITNMKLFNQNVPISTPGNGDSNSRFTLEKHISITEEITLSYDQAFFSFDYAALNYRQPEQNEYAYYLEGLENDWNYVQNRRTAYYTSVPYGEYVFHVKGSNNDGIWNEKGASIRIIITPPWWLSLWAKMLWLGIAIGLLLTIYKIRVNNLKRQKATLENEVATRTQEIMRQKEEMETQAENLKKMNWEIQDRNNEILTQSEFIQEVNNELKDKNDALEKAYQNVALLSAIGQHITAQLSMGDMIREVYQNVQSLMQVDEFAVGRYEADSGEIVFEAFFGNNRPHGAISIKETHRLSVQCVLNKQEIFISDVEKDYPQYAGHSHAAYQDELLRALIVLPLVSGEEVTGLIWVQSMEKNAYSPHELDLLKNLAAYVSIALDNAKAYRKIKNQRQDLEKAQKVIREQNKSLSNTNILLEEKVEQRTRELNHLTYRSAHDLKGPISRLLGLCYACQLDLKESLDQVSPQFRPKLVEYLKKMEGTAISMQQMLSRLLRIHDIKMRTPAIREVSLQTVIENTWRTVIVRVNTAANINFQVDVASMGSIQTDPKLLSLLLENLYENAAQFADPAKGINYIKTEVCNQENELILKITDNGLGIDQTLTDDIFNMFVKGTTESKGVGLGLYESKIIIEKLKGSLQVDMHAQGVTVFEVRIPFLGEQ